LTAKLLEMAKIYKSFPGVVAVNNVDLEVDKGEVLALIGENGAGKSTLIKILAGALQAESGKIFIEGKEVHIQTPREGLNLGISVIYQELNYMNEMSIAENMLLDQLPKQGKSKILDYTALKKKSMEIQELIGLEKYDPMTNLIDLTVGEKQLIEIGKAYARNAKIIVMDEPTSALTLEEVDKLFLIIQKLKKNNVGIIYISHKMDEIMEISDRVEVMRDGCEVFEAKTADVTKDDLITKMVGREITEMYPSGNRIIGKEILQVKDLSNKHLSDISFTLHEGEIIGLYGLMGCGTDDIMKCIYGAEEYGKGDIFVNGKKTNINSPRDGIQNGMAYVPAERKTEGLILKQSIKSNIVISSIGNFMKKFRMDKKAEEEAAEKWAKRLKVKAPGIETEVAQLSGGNQQKVILAKCMLTHPKILILNEPTKGIDVGAKAEIYKLMEEICKQGVGIVFMSSEMPEVMNMADKIIVVHEGRITHVYSRAEATQENIMRSAVGE
jgi:ABC-type sugar transport system ATPase subunit